MLNKYLIAAIMFAMPFAAVAEEEIIFVEQDIPVFRQIADLEQDKVLLQLEKEKAQLMLDLDRMTTEQMRVRNEMDELSGRAEADRRKLEAEREKLEQEREAMRRSAERSAEQPAAPRPEQTKEAPPPTPRMTVTERYRLVDIVGVGNQLQATIEDTKTMQRRRVWAGREIDGFMINSVSLDEGVVFEKDGEIETLGLRIGD
ncbi:MAG: hypothetical protein FWF34_01195 [Alphaproteobacteria bacterium]|nr:hypothetical protein [Alphaproteobacteria bacterium]MCL2889857.1 hypothetical protein [Alphaproteobacteria bacterium]